MEKPKGGVNMRSSATIRRLNMYRKGKPLRYILYKQAELFKLRISEGFCWVSKMFQEHLLNY